MFLQGETSYTPTLIVPAGGRLMYHSLGRKVYTAFSIIIRRVFISFLNTTVLLKKQYSTLTQDRDPERPIELLQVHFLFYRYES